jgi:D-tyrosyl-tRNA(Tyr) deacylase
VILQRVSQASVTVEGKIVGEIQRGLLLLVGAEATDT